MAVWSRSKNQIQRTIETKVRAVRGLALITAEERFCIFAAINEAIIDLSVARGIDAPKVTTSDTTATTVASQNYVDLSSGVIQVIDGTVRIEAEDQILTPFDGDAISAFYAVDPGEDASACPTRYAIDTDGSGTMRLLLRDTPDAVYTIALKVETLPDEDDITTYPAMYLPALRSKASSIALESLGLEARFDEARYRDRLKDLREKLRGRSGPFHIPMRQQSALSRAPELRATI